MDTHTCAISPDKFVYMVMVRFANRKGALFKHSYERGKVMYVKELQGTIGDPNR